MLHLVFIRILVQVLIPLCEKQQHQVYSSIRVLIVHSLLVYRPCLAPPALVLSSDGNDITKIWNHGRVRPPPSQSILAIAIYFYRPPNATPPYARS